MSETKIKRIMIDKDKCVSCLGCVVACMVKHNEDGDSIYDLNLSDPKNDSKIHIEVDYKGNPIPILCRHCDKPECVLTCMSGAMTKDEDTGLVTYDEEQCASCFMCVMSCPYGVLKPDRVEGKVVIKCERCKDLDIPACVENCPTGALYILKGDE